MCSRKMGSWARKRMEISFRHGWDWQWQDCDASSELAPMASSDLHGRHAQH